MEAEGIKCFKASEYYGLRGQFVKSQSESKYPPPTGREAARRVFDDLQQIIRQADITSLGVLIPGRDYNEVIAMPDAQGKIPAAPYLLALNSNFFETVEAVNQNPGKHMVTFVHDDDDKFPVYRSTDVAFRKRIPKPQSRLLDSSRSTNDIVSPEILRSKPRLRGTRIPVGLVLGCLAAGKTADNNVVEFPDLTRDQIAACLDHARELAESFDGLAVFGRPLCLERHRSNLANLTLHGLGTKTNTRRVPFPPPDPPASGV